MNDKVKGPGPISLGDSKVVRATWDRRNLIQSVGDMLSERHWSHFVTLTTVHERSADYLRWHFLNQYHRRLTAKAQQSVPFFYVIEGGTGDQQAHIHALLGGTENLPEWQVQKAWTKGRTHVERYAPLRGAAYYLSKTFGDRHDNYDWSRRLPSRVEAVERTIPAI